MVAFIFKQSIYVNHYANTWQNYQLGNSDGFPGYKAAVAMRQEKAMNLGIRDLYFFLCKTLLWKARELAGDSNTKLNLLEIITRCRLHNQRCLHNLISLSTLKSMIPWLLAATAELDMGDTGTQWAERSMVCVCCFPHLIWGFAASIWKGSSAVLAHVASQIWGVGLGGHRRGGGTWKNTQHVPCPMSHHSLVGIVTRTAFDLPSPKEWNLFKQECWNFRACR